MAEEEFNGLLIIERISFSMYFRCRMIRKFFLEFFNDDVINKESMVEKL